MKHIYISTDEEVEKQIIDRARFAPPQPQRFTYDGRVKALSDCLIAVLNKAQKETQSFEINEDGLNKIKYHYEKLFELMENKDKEQKFSRLQKISHVEKIIVDIIEEWGKTSKAPNLDSNKILNSVKDKIYDKEVAVEEDVSL